jgi:DnaJ-class molecular chaperone
VKLKQWTKTKFAPSIFGGPWIRCVVCGGSGVLVSGLLHVLCCWGCHGAGVVHRERAIKLLAGLQDKVVEEEALE